MFYFFLLLGVLSSSRGQSQVPLQQLATNAAQAVTNAAQTANLVSSAYPGLQNYISGVSSSNAIPGLQNYVSGQSTSNTIPGFNGLSNSIQQGISTNLTPTSQSLHPLAQPIVVEPTEQNSGVSQAQLDNYLYEQSFARNPYGYFGPTRPYQQSQFGPYQQFNHNPIHAYRRSIGNPFFGNRRSYNNFYDYQPFGYDDYEGRYFDGAYDRLSGAPIDPYEGFGDFGGYDYDNVGFNGNQGYGGYFGGSQFNRFGGGYNENPYGSLNRLARASAGRLARNTPIPVRARRGGNVIRATPFLTSSGTPAIIPSRWW